MVRRILFQQITLDPDWVHQQIVEFLAEDVPAGDVTTDGVAPNDVTATAQIKAGEKLIFAGAAVVQGCFLNRCDVELNVADGQPVAAGEIIGTIAGPARYILTRERVMLNLIQHLSGIATLTRAYVNEASPFGVKILDTRKTIPGLRSFEKYAVAVGGGVNHRLDLSSGILVKDNHIATTGSIAGAVKSLRRRYPDMPIEVEVETRAQVEAGLAAGVDAFLLDNMPVEEVHACVTLIRDHACGKDIFIEASGGIKLDNVAKYAQTGVDGLSVGYLTHSAPFVDISLDLFT